MCLYSFYEKYSHEKLHQTYLVILIEILLPIVNGCYCYMFIDIFKKPHVSTKEFIFIKYKLLLFSLMNNTIISPNKTPGNFQPLHI